MSKIFKARTEGALCSLYEYLKRCQEENLGSAIQTVGEGNLRKDGRMPGGIFAGIGRRGGEGLTGGVFPLWGGLKGRLVRLPVWGNGCGMAVRGNEAVREGYGGRA